VGASEKYLRAESQGKIVGVVDYGVFVELEQGMKGWSTFRNDWNKKVTHPSKIAKVVTKVECGM